MGGVDRRKIDAENFWYYNDCMLLRYQSYGFSLVFEEKIIATLNSISTFRGILGMNLKSMSCISANKNCADCLYSNICVYTTLFESFVSKDNKILQGRNTASHPYIILLGNNQSEPSKTISLSVILLGKYIEYFPYVYGAFVRAGQRGFGKNRIPFFVKDISVDEKSILINENKIKTDSAVKTWSTSSDENIKTGEIQIQLKTPLRYKAGNVYADKIEVAEFMKCLYRRAKTLCGFYGVLDENDEFLSEDHNRIEVSECNIKWRENERYSARQKSKMSLGGMIGDFTLKGHFTQRDLDLIEFACIFGAGKNTNFGLGRINVMKKLT